METAEKQKEITPLLSSPPPPHPQTALTADSWVRFVAREGRESSSKGEGNTQLVVAVAFVTYYNINGKYDCKK